MSCPEPELLRDGGGHSALRRADEGFCSLAMARAGSTPMSGARSGLLVYGDQRGAAYSDYDADGRLDLVVSQNAAATTPLSQSRAQRQAFASAFAARRPIQTRIGAQVRVVYGARMGPVREIQAGSGYWSENGAVQVFGTAEVPTEVWVRWPGGGEARVRVPPAAREVTVTRGR